MSSGPNNSSCRVPVYAGPCHLRTLNQVDGVYLRYISSLTCNYPIRRGGHRAAGSQRGPCAGTANRGSGYLPSSLVTARPMSIRWISGVPSKMVKIVDYGAVSVGQRPVDPRGISTDPARVVRGESRFPSGPCTHSTVGTSKVYSSADLALSHRPGHPAGRPATGGRGRIRAGRTGNAGNPGLAAVTPIWRRHGPDGPAKSRQCRQARAAALTTSGSGHADTTEGARGLHRNLPRLVLDLSARPRRHRAREPGA